MKKCFISGALTLCLCFSLLCTGAGASGIKQEAVQALGILTGGNWNSPVTRAQFAQMLTAASSYKDGVEGYGSSLFKDLKGDYWASGYVRIAIEQGWMSGYVDGTFRPEQAVTLEEGCAALLKVLGYDAGALKGAYPAAQLAKAKSIGLLDGVSAEQGDPLIRQDCVNLFYNLLIAQTSAGTVYGAALGYPVANGQVDYSALVTTDTKGPYVAERADLSLPFTPDTVYYNGAASSLSALQQYDVYYYNANLSAVWIYHDSVTGTLSEISPNRAAPTAVTVAGVSYQIGTSDAAYQLSSQGEFREGDIVTLLLGMNGEAVQVMAALEQEAVYYGTVVSSTKAVSNAATTNSTASAQVTTRIACTDGIVRTFYHSGGVLSAGQLVTVSITQSETLVKNLSARKLEGTVSQDGASFAGYDFAAGVQILDTDSGGGYVRVYPSRLAGARLSGEDVRCYTLNASGEIERMVLRNVTGDAQSYGYISGIEDNSSEMHISIHYTYIQDGQIQSVSNSSSRYAVQTGGAALIYEKGSLKSIRQLGSVRLDSLSALSAMGEDKAYKIAEDVQVLLRDRASQAYYQTSLSQVNGEDYKLTGWYDNLGYSAGGYIRIIVADPR